MIKILIVEDTQEKLSKITRTLLEIPGVDLTSITTVMDALNAKRDLEKNNYDLLILDIAIPSRIDQDIEQDGGVKLLDEIVERERFNTPSHIIGMTAHSEILATAKERFSRRLLTVVYFDPMTDEWETSLQSRVKHIIDAKKSEGMGEVDFKSYLAIICALESPELQSILQLSWGWEQLNLPNDLNIYYRGVIHKYGKKRTIYAAAASRMGMPAASILSMKMIANFRPQYLAMPGITAGVPGKAKYGDVIVANPSWDWGSGKWELRKGELQFFPDPHQLYLDHELRAKIKQMNSDKSFLYKIRQDWPADPPEHELSLHIGPLASGASVLADGSFVELIKRQHRKVIGIEMETYGVFAAADEAQSPRPKAFSMKSVVDFADTSKDDKYRRYASFTSAQVLKHFVENYL